MLRISNDSGFGWILGVVAQIRCPLNFVVVCSCAAISAVAFAVKAQTVREPEAVHKSPKPCLPKPNTHSLKASVRGYLPLNP